jgi:hypothetical protein
VPSEILPPLSWAEKVYRERQFKGAAKLLTCPVRPHGLGCGPRFEIKGIFTVEEVV